METREDLGYVKSDPRVNERIIRKLGLERSVSVTGEVSPEVIEGAHGILSAEFLKHGVNDKGRRTVMSQLRQIGYPLDSYSRMNAAELRVYLGRITREVNGCVAGLSFI